MKKKSAAHHGEQAAHLQRSMKRATDNCGCWAPLAFEVKETTGSSLLKSVLLALRRAPVLFNIRALEIQLQSQNTAIQQTTDTDLLLEMIDARRETRDELAMARRQYSALLPVGVVKVWAIY